MKYVYVVSPHFLEAMRDESMPYSFAIKGYPSIKDGRKNLMYTNISDIIGFAIVLYELPNDLYPLIDLLQAIDRISNGHPIILSSFFKDGIDIVLDNINLLNSTLIVHTDLECMTDIEIRRGIYGSILKEVYKPYEPPKDEDLIPVISPDICHYVPLLNERIMQLSEDIPIAPDYAKAIGIDPVVEKTRDSDLIIYLLRCEMIRRKYGLEPDSRVKTKFKAVLQDEPDKLTRLQFESIFNLIWEGRIWI